MGSSWPRKTADEGEKIETKKRKRKRTENTRRSMRDRQSERGAGDVKSQKHSTPPKKKKKKTIDDMLLSLLLRTGGQAQATSRHDVSDPSGEDGRIDHGKESLRSGKEGVASLGGPTRVEFHPSHVL